MASQKRLRPSDYLRCSGCGRLVEKVNAKPGPDGGMFGSECLSRAILNATRPITPPAYRHDESVESA